MGLIGALLPGMNISVLLGMNVTNAAPGGPDIRFCQLSRVRIYLKKTRLVRSFRSQKVMQNQ